MARKEVTRLLDAVLGTELDDFMAGAGFRRRGGTLKYSRNVSDGAQRVDMHFDAKPSYAPQALAHLLPQHSIIFPKLNLLMSNLIDGFVLPSKSPAREITFSQQIQHVSPPGDTRCPPRWFLHDKSSAVACIQSAKDYMAQWEIPFLDKYQSVASLIDGYEQRDSRLPHDQRFTLFIAGAYLLIGRARSAMGVLEANFGNAGSREDFAKAFEYVADILAATPA
jgi:hypothetical protein